LLKYKNIVKRKCNLTSRQNIQPQGLIDYPCMLLPIHIQTIGYHRNYCGRWLTQPLCPPLWYFLTYLCVTLHRGRHFFYPCLLQVLYGSTTNAFIFSRNIMLTIRIQSVFYYHINCFCHKTPIYPIYGGQKWN
jgi:hypothetical protein